MSSANEVEQDSVALCLQAAQSYDGRLSASDWDLVAVAPTVATNHPLLHHSTLLLLLPHQTAAALVRA